MLKLSGEYWSMTSVPFFREPVQTVLDHARTVDGDGLGLAEYTRRWPGEGEFIACG